MPLQNDPSVYREQGKEEALLFLLLIAFRHMTDDQGVKYKSVFEGSSSAFFRLVKDKLHFLPTEDHLLEDFERGFTEGVDRARAVFRRALREREGGDLD